MKKNIKGSFTIEAAVIVPIVLLIFGILLHILFYWHDKMILVSTAHEAAAVGNSRSEWSELELEYYFFSRMEGKMLLFDRVECTAYVEDDRVRVVYDGSKGSMVAKGECSINRIEPEDYIRDIRKIEKFGEGIVK